MTDDKYILKLTPAALLAWVLGFAGVAVISLFVDDYVAAAVISAGWAAVVLFFGLGVQTWGEYGPGSLATQREEALKAADAAAAEAEASSAAASAAVAESPEAPAQDPRWAISKVTRSIPFFEQLDLPDPRVGAALRAILAKSEVAAWEQRLAASEYARELWNPNDFLYLTSQVSAAAAEPENEGAQRAAISGLLGLLALDPNLDEVRSALELARDVLGITEADLRQLLTRAIEVAENPRVAPSQE